MNLENVRHRLTILLMLTIKHLNFFPTAKTRVHCDLIGYVVVQLYDFRDLFQLYIPSANFERTPFLQNYTIEMYFCHFRKHPCSLTMSVCPQKESYIYSHAPTMYSKVAPSGSNGH